MKRTHTCGQLDEKDIDKKVVLQGWVDARRDHGNIIFIDIRDRYGITQLVFDSTKSKEAHKIADSLRREFVIEISGVVKRRPSGLENPNIATGKIEVHCNNLEIVSPAETPPLDIEDRVVAAEEARLKYRYLDLRRPIMQRRLILRHNVAQAAREFLNLQGFLEIETPFLLKHTPEGARDFIVPSRLHPGKAYSLPQSPQLYKQILMVSGFDRYYQIARCLRDEDLRSDRQPEFTQIDVEMSFVDEDDIYAVGEGLIKHLFKKVLGLDIKIPFKRISYNETMEKYGTDKPDIRFGLELVDVTRVLRESNFEVFRNSALIKCINAKGCANFSKSELNELLRIAHEQGAKGLVTIKIKDSEMESMVAKYLSDKIRKELIKSTNAQNGDLLLIVAGEQKTTNSALAAIRNYLGKKLNLYNPKEFLFCWVVDFPLFEWNEEEQKWDAAHHIFTMPKTEHIALLEKDPGKVHAKCYDLVLNGVELASGSIRIHRADIQERVMKVIGLKKEDVEKKFGFLLEAFKYGAPPHGGFAIGFDRLVAMMCGINDIREVIAFPKTKNAECPMDGSPSEVEPKLLKELHLKFEVPKKR